MNRRLATQGGNLKNLRLREVSTLKPGGVPNVFGFSSSQQPAKAQSDSEDENNEDLTHSEEEN